MEGAAAAAKARQDLAFWQAWHVEAFARMEGKHFVKALSDHFGEKTKTANRHAEAIAFFHHLQASGIPVEITKH